MVTRENWNNFAFSLSQVEAAGGEGTNALA
jgi:hypothetical protein